MIPAAEVAPGVLGFNLIPWCIGFGFFNLTWLAIWARKDLTTQRKRGYALFGVIGLSIAVTLIGTVVLRVVGEYIVNIFQVAAGFAVGIFWILAVAHLAAKKGEGFQWVGKVLAKIGNAASFLHRRKRRLQAELIETEVRLAQLKADPYYTAAMGELEVFLAPYKELMPPGAGDVPIAALAEAKARAQQLLLEKQVSAEVKDNNGFSTSAKWLPWPK